MPPHSEPPTALISREALEDLIAASAPEGVPRPPWSLSRVAFAIVVGLIALFVVLLVKIS